MNDIEKAIEYFKNATISFVDAKSGAQAMKVRDLAISALEKQMPKKPTKIKSVEFKGSVRMSFKSADCPACGEHIDTDDEPFFCSHRGCGQAIDWNINTEID